MKLDSVLYIVAAGAAVAALVMLARKQAAAAKPGPNVGDAPALRTDAQNEAFRDRLFRDELRGQPDFWI